MTLSELFKNSTDKFSSSPAVIFRSRYRTITWTYKDLGDYALRVAANLRKAGVRKGDPVLLWAGNSPDWVAVFFGIVISGGAVIPIHSENTADFVRKVASRTKSVFLIKDPLFELSSSNLKIFLTGGLFDGPSPEWESFPAGSSGDVLEIVYTSGTTGDPKGVPLTHLNIISNIDGLGRAIDILKKDRFLSILPLSHMFEQTVGMILPISKGASVIYISHPSSGTIMSALRENKATKMVAVPEFLRIVMKRIETAAADEGREALFSFFRRVAVKLPFLFRRILFSGIHKKFGGKLQIIASGGAALDPAVQEKWELLGFDILQGYGLTETSPVLTVNTLKKRKAGSVGKPLFGVEIKIASDGEILAQGPNVFRGYFNDEARTRESFTCDGWFKTGDIGETDEDGFVYIKGRKKYIILGPSGQNVYPEDIESQINDQPGVSDSAVLGLEKAGRVEIHAVLLLEKGVDPRAVIEAANKNLSQFQRVHNFSVWPEEDFPRSVTRKVRKEIVLSKISQIEERKIEAKRRGTDVTPVTKIVGDIFEVDPSEIAGEIELASDLGLDSILRIELVARIEEQLGVFIDEASITERTSISDLEKIVAEGRRQLGGRGDLISRWPHSLPVGWLRKTLHFVFIRPLVRFICRADVYGMEALDNLSGPVIIMPNHRSVIDPLVLFSILPSRVRERVGFALAADIAAIRWFPMAIAELLYGAFPFPRGRGEEKNIEFGLSAVGRLLDSGRSVVVYPEGAISRSENITQLKRGAGLLALEMKVPVIPVFMSGTQKIVPWGKIFPRRRAGVAVRFGEPLYFEGETYDEATDKIAAALSRLKGEAEKYSVN